MKKLYVSQLTIFAKQWRICTEVVTHSLMHRQWPNQNYTGICWAFTVYGLLLMELQLYQPVTFDSYNQYVNNTLKNVYCQAFYLHSVNEWMWTLT